MEDGVLGSTNKDHNRSSNNHIKMLQRQAPSSSYNTDHLSSHIIPLNNLSRMITNKRPHKIRIIHIVPPKIIHTNKANFRDLVQSLTGRSATNTGHIKKRRRHHQMIPHVSSSDINMNHLLGFGGSNSNNSSYNTDFSSNEKSSLDEYDPACNDHHEQHNLDVSSDHHEIISGGLFQAKVEREEIMMVQNQFDTEIWGMKDKFENGFCIDGFLELDEWLPQDIKLPNLMLNAADDSNWEIDPLLGEL